MQDENLKVEIDKYKNDPHRQTLFDAAISLTCQFKQQQLCHHSLQLAIQSQLEAKGMTIDWRRVATQYRTLISLGSIKSALGLYQEIIKASEN